MIKPEFKTVNDIYNSFITETPSDQQIMCFNELVLNKMQFEQQVDFITKHLIHIGVKQGMVVGYTIPNCPEAFALFISVSRLGACALPLFHMTPDTVKAGVYAKAGAQFVITTSQQFPGLKEQAQKTNATFKIATLDNCDAADFSFANNDISAVKNEGNVLHDLDPKQPLLIASSSGTTGIPKMVIMTQSNVASELIVAQELSLPLLAGEKMAIAFPLSTAGVIVCLGTLFAGLCQIFSADVSPVKYMQLVSHWKPKFMACPPSYYEAILSLPMLATFDLTSVKRVMVGMDFFSPSLLKKLKDKFINIEGFSNGYGLIETCNVFMICKVLDENLLSTSHTSKMVIACNANQLEVKDENGKIVPFGTKGELYVKGANVVGGYINNPEESAASFKDGWFRTGDVVQSESENCVTLLGRKKYLIKRGGKSVSPIVVQNHINQLEGVMNCAVVGVPHPLYGEMVWSFIVKKQGTTIEFKDVMKHCRAELVNYMVPDQVVFIDEIPKNPGVGKVNYEKLKELAINELKSIEG